MMTKVSDLPMLMEDACQSLKTMHSRPQHLLIIYNHFVIISSTNYIQANASHYLFLKCIQTYHDFQMQRLMSTECS